MKDSSKHFKFKILYNKLIDDWYDLNLYFKALMIIMFIIIIVLFSDIFIKKLSHDTSILFESTILSITGFLLSSNKKQKTTQGMFRIKKDYSEEIEEYKYSDGNLVQIIISIFLITICIIAIIIINFIDTYSFFYFFKDLMNISIGFLLGESKINK